MGYHGNVLVEPTSGYCIYIYIIYITLITYIYIYNVYTQNHGQYVYIYICAMVKLRRLYGFKFMVIHHMSRVSSSIMGFCEPLSEWIFLTIQKGQKKIHT